MVLYYLIDRKKRNLLTVSAIITAVLLNGLFNYLNNLAGLPIFLNSTFTVMTASLFGLWPAVVVGLLSNVFIELLNGFPGSYIPFTAVNLLTALVTTAFVKNKHFETATHAFWLIIILSAINSLAGSLIVTFLLGGNTGHGIDNLVKSITVSGQSAFSASFFVLIVVNIVDKGLAILPSFFLYKKIQCLADQKS